MKKSPLLLRSMAWTSLVFIVNACSVYDIEVSPEPKTSRETQNAYVGNTIWTKDKLHVCFEDINTYSTQMVWIREAIENTWATESSMTFYWDTSMPCAQQPTRDLRISLAPTCNYTNTTCFGSGCEDVVGGINIQVCTSLTLDGQFAETQWHAVHEFGHALDYYHEQERGDDPNWCTTDGYRDQHGSVTFGAWDQYSIMNYCNPNGSNMSPGSFPHLTSDDVYAAENYYGSQFPFATASPTGWGLDLYMRDISSRHEQLRSYTGSWSNVRTVTTDYPSSASSAVLTNQAREDIFYRAPNGDLMQLTDFAGTFPAPTDLSTPGREIIGEPVAVSRSTDQITVIVRTYIPGNWNNPAPSATVALSAREWTAAAGWSPWVDLPTGVDVVGKPSVVVGQDGAAYVFVNAYDFQVHLFRSPAPGNWSGTWTTLSTGSGGYHVLGAPAGVKRINASNLNNVAVFARMSNNHIYYWATIAGSSTFWGPYDLSGPAVHSFQGSPSAVSTPSFMFVFIKDDSGQTWSQSQNTSNVWSGWPGTPIYTSYVGSPYAAVDNRTNAVHLFENNPIYPGAINEYMFTTYWTHLGNWLGIGAF